MWFERTVERRSSGPLSGGSESDRFSMPTGSWFGRPFTNDFAVTNDNSTNRRPRCDSAQRMFGKFECPIERCGLWTVDD